MARLQTLRSGLATLNTNRLPVLSLNPDATPRMTGRRLMERNAKWLKANPLCLACKEQDCIVTAGQQVDHIIPLWKGGADHESNLQSLCIEHHKAKTAQETSERAAGCGFLTLPKGRNG
jgi:5-methylcytosine-specific restriction protein A